MIASTVAGFSILLIRIAATTTVNALSDGHGSSSFFIAQISHADHIRYCSPFHRKYEFCDDGSGASSRQRGFFADGIPSAATDHVLGVLAITKEE